MVSNSCLILLCCSATVAYNCKDRHFQREVSLSTESEVFFVLQILQKSQVKKSQDKQVKTDNFERYS